MSTILVVEGGTSAAMSLATTLSEAGFRVHREHGTQPAIAAVEKFDFDAAIIADALPGMGEEEVAQWLRERDPELPIFVCTGYDEESVVRWAAQERMLVLEKPVDEAQLIWLLHAHVRQG
jgi:DNA-binding response OmpR family regulator